MSKFIKLKYGMIGGGPGAFIGDVHRKAAGLDGEVELVAGVFNRDIQKSKEMGEQLGLDSSRVYKDYSEMVKGESALPKDQRIDFVVITTPNNWHFPIARDFLNAGFHVLCEKPMTMDVKEAKELKALVEKTGLIFALNHNYTGYPMVKLARDMVKKGKLGKIRKVISIYPQGWLASALEQTGSKQATWRVDPKQAGPAGCMGDIGSHAENLAEYITGKKITEVCADLTTFVEGRPLDDDANLLIKLEDGIHGILHASQISIGEENGLAIWVYGEKGSIEWHQEHPNYLYFKEPNAPVQVWRRGNEYIGQYSEAAGRATRLPFGHPEAFIEAMGNIYRNFAETVQAYKSGTSPHPLALDFPGVEDGLRGIAFIETVLASSQSTTKWTPFKY